MCLENTNIKTQKTGLHTDLLLTYDSQLRSPIIPKPRLLKLNYDSYYGNYNVQEFLDHYILQLEVWSISL